MRLDRTQVLWLTLGGVVALGLMCAFGFVLGQRAARIAAVPTGSPIAEADAAHALQGEVPAEELTFYDALKKPQSDRATRSAPASPPPAPTPIAKPRARAPAAAKQSPSAADSEVASAVARARSALQGATQQTTNAAATPGILRTALDSGPAQDGEFTVQVSAFQSRGEADAYASGLQRKGYRPFVVESSIAGRGVWYRVRLGRFVTEHEAERAKQMLASADIPAWVLMAD